MSVIKGKNIWLGDQERVLAPLNLNQIEALEEDINTFQDPKTNISTMLKAAKKIVQASLSRNYKDITVEQVGDMLDMSNVKDCVFAALAISGYANAGNGSEGGEAKK